MNKFLISISLLFLSLFANYSYAQGPADIIPEGVLLSNFGGYVVVGFPCTCTMSYAMYVLDVRTLSDPTNLQSFLNLESITQLEQLGDLMPMKVIMVFPLVFSRINLNYAPVKGNYVLGTTIDTGLFKSKFMSGVMQKLGIVSSASKRNFNKYLGGCYVGVPPVCVPWPGVVPTEVLTPFPFSGMGTSLKPAVIPI